MAKKETNQKIIKDLLENLLDLLSIQCEFEIEKIDSDSDEESYSVKIETKNQDEGLLIGTHGANLQALESFMNLAVRQQKGEWVRVNLEIGDWRKKQKDSLVSLGEQAAKRAKETGEPQFLYNLTPQQRREIHVSLKENDEIETYSEGEGENRYLVIKSR